MREDQAMIDTTDSLRLFRRRWLPDSTPRADVAIIHGFAEHSGRYSRLAQYLTDRGYVVTAVDLRGHGRSDGPAALVRSFNEYLDDLETLLTDVRATGGPEPRTLFLLGHSMGGAVAALAAVSRRPRIDGLLLSGAAITAPSGPSRLLARVVLLVGRYFPKLGLRKLPSDAVSRDPAVVADYDSDPLNYRGKVPAGLAAAMLRASDTIERRTPRIDVPLLVMHGSEDALADPDASRRLYDRATSKDKTLKIYEGLYHEILNEPEQEMVMADIADWLDSRCPAASTARVDAAR